MVEAASGLYANDLLAQVRFYPVKVFVRLRKLLIRVAKYVLHLRNFVSHVNRQGGTIFASRETENVTGFAHFSSPSGVIWAQSTRDAAAIPIRLFRIINCPISASNCFKVLSSFSSI